MDPVPVEGERCVIGKLNIVQEVVCSHRMSLGPVHKINDHFPNHNAIHH